MLSLPSQFYAEWRASALALSALQETREGAPGERLLHQVWQHQRLRRDSLQTLDGRPVRILHPGFWNHEAGPDFLDAVVQFGTDPPRTGDVEIDLRAGDWRGHRHHANLAYLDVMLHVVWEAEPGGESALPTLTLKSRLDAPLDELASWADLEPGLPPGLVGRCASPLHGLSGPVLAELLQQAALVRLQRKGLELAARARQIGWDQALWEGLFGALGYKHNSWPMRRIAEQLPRLAAPATPPESTSSPTNPATVPGPLARTPAPTRPGGGNPPADALALQARLLGISNLLPHEPARTRTGAAEYVRRLWDLWWRERDLFADDALPRSLWRLGGLRPANHPQRRLALAAHWLARGDLCLRLDRWFATELPAGRAAAALLGTLQIDHDPFWSWHWTLRSARMKRPQPLLGAQRLTDLAVNVVLPWFWVRAGAGENEALRRVAELRYLGWPSAQDNAVLRRARQRLLGGASPRLFQTAACQQGLLQIVHDFCGRSNALCQNCTLPDRLWAVNKVVKIE